MNQTRSFILAFLAGPLFLVVSKTFMSAFPGGASAYVVFLSIILSILWIVILIFYSAVMALTLRPVKFMAGMLTISAFFCFIFGLRDVGDYGHLVLLYPHYMSVISRSGGKQRITFDWGDAAITVLDGLRYKTLVYDTSGSEAGKVGQIIEAPDGDGLKISTKHLLGCFYLETEFSA